MRSPAVLSAGIALLLSGDAFGQAFTFTNGGQLFYTENFDSMATAGSYAPGWTAIRASGSGLAGETLTPTSSNGSGTNLSGGVFSAGTTGATDRAFGALASGSASPAFGTSFLNSTGMNVGAVSFTGIMEQWRSGTNNSVTEITPFEYSFNASSLATGSWTRLNSFDLVEKRTEFTTSSSLDGNAEANRTTLQTGSVPVLWETGTSMWIRWTDPDDTGSDAMLAIEDFRLDVTLAAATKNLTWAPTAIAGGTSWNTSAQNWLDGNTRTAFSTNDSVTFSDSGRAAGATVVIDAAGVTANRVNVTNTTGTYRLEGGAFNALNGMTKTGAGVLELAAKYDGVNLVVDGGTLRTVAPNRLNSSALVSVGAGATLDFNSNEHTIAGLTLTGGAVTGAVLNVNGNLTAQANQTASTIAGNALVILGTNRTITASEGAALTINAPVDGITSQFSASRVNIAGPGTIRFNRASPSSGGFSIDPNGTSSPRVIVGHNGAFGTGDLRFNGGTLEGGTALTGSDAINTRISIGGNVVMAGEAMEFSNQISILQFDHSEPDHHGE